MLKLILHWWKAKSLLWAVLITLGIIILSLINPKTIIKNELSISDKLLHLFAYFILYWVWMMYVRERKIKLKPPFLLVILITVGIILEVLQGTATHTRTADYHDVIANVLGLIVGFISFPIVFSKKIENL
jgi:VanZ family protein